MPDSLILPCQCGTLNRVPRDRMEDGPLCADCHLPLLSGVPVDLDGDTFATFVERSDIPVVVDFWAPWCGPCKVMGPHFSAAAERLAGTARLAKLDTQQFPELASRYNIQGIPTMAAFAKGTEIARTSGVRTGRFVSPIGVGTVTTYTLHGSSAAGALV